MTRYSFVVLANVCVSLLLVSCEDDDSSEESSGDVANVQSVQESGLTSTSTSSIEIPFESLNNNYRFGKTPLEIVIRSQAEYETLPLAFQNWNPGPPNVDFDTDMLIGVFGGTHPLEGIRLFRIRSVLLQDGIIRVTYWNKIAVGFFSFGHNLSGLIIKLARYDVPVQFIEDNNAP